MLQVTFPTEGDGREWQFLHGHFTYSKTIYTSNSFYFHFTGSTLGLAFLDFSLFLQWLFFPIFLKIDVYCSMSCLHCLENSRLGSSIGVVLDGEKIFVWHFSVC